MAQRFTKEDIIAAMNAGTITYEGLGELFGLTPQSMKSAMDKLGLVGGQRPHPSTSASITNDFITWDELYKQYPDTQTQFLIAECKVKRNMTAAQTADWIKQNVIRNESNFVWSTFKEAQIRTRLERIARLKTMGVLVTYPWMVETYNKARTMGIDLADYGL